MKKLDWFILKTYLGPLVLTFFIALFILLMQFLWKYVDDLVGKGLEWYIIFKLLFYASSTFVPLALPLAILLSSLMMFGNLGEHYELVSMKAAGISLRRIMLPLVIVSFLISGLAFYFSNDILPKANLKFLSLLYDVRSKKLAFNLKNGVFYDGIEGYVIRVGKKEKDGNTIRDVMIYDHTKHMGNVSVTTAKWGKMELSPDKKYLIFLLYDGMNYEERTDLRRHEVTRPFQRTKFKEQHQLFDLSAFQLTRTDEALFKKNYEMLNLRNLMASIDSMHNEVKRQRDIYHNSLQTNYTFFCRLDSVLTVPADTLQAFNPAVLLNFDCSDWYSIFQSAKANSLSMKENIEMHERNLYGKSKLLHKHEIVLQKKFTFSIACFLLFFIGAPLGAIIRKGGLGMPAVVATLFFVLFWIVSFTGEKYTAEGVLPAWQGMWIAPLLLLPIGIFLTYKATIDASLLDVDAWLRFFQKLLKIPTKPAS
ncbi:MAG: LptF/LptG family permease [Bacteroidales bacterium]|nr:LptF/LptG family permease [Bacteroidales bacterium]